MNQYPEDQIDSLSQDDGINIKKILRRFLQFWPWFLLSLVIGFGLAYLANKLATPAYRASSTLLIKEDRGRRSQRDVMSNFDVFGSSNNLANEMVILRSYSLNYKTVQDLSLYISYNKQGKYRQKDIYNSCPFVVVPDTSHVQGLNTEISIVPISNTHVKITANYEGSIRAMNYNTGEVVSINPDQSCKGSVELAFGELYQNSCFSFRVLPIADMGAGHINLDYFVIFRDINAVTSSFRSRLSVDPVNEESSIVQISFVDAIPERAMDYINTLASNYIHLGLSEKNLIAERTIAFIDQQLAGITDTLNVIEKDLASFRTDNKIINLSAQGQAVFQKLQTIEYDRSLEQMRLGYYNYILKYVQNDTLGKDLIAPSAMGISDPLLTSLIMQLSQLYTQREQLKSTSTSKNPYLVDIELQIETLKRTIVENLNNIISNSKYVLSEKQKQLIQVQGELQTLPQTERQLIKIERMFTVNDQIYTFLLQKRAESAIAMASNISDHKVIDSARVDAQISPKTKQNLRFAILLALLIPALLIFLYDQIRNTIKDISDVEALTKVPILGNVLHHAEGEPDALNVSGHVVESFRAIRTNLDFFVSEKDRKVISVTSMNPGEGKSFCSFYLAYVFSLAGKKTLLVGADIRKPDNGKFFKQNVDKGLSTFLSRKHEWSEILLDTGHENLTFIPAGPLPPNPAELLSPENIDRILECTDQYDVVVIDTSPIGIIADAAYILRKTDVNLFVARYNVSRKPDIKMINQIIHKLNVKHPALICNDMKRKGRKYYYNYYYYNADKGKRFGKLF